ncbi:hypothetical protein BTM25_56120 [Actinomadura rubteroloni]|uniref:Uncharacterized protein n=1 Tax=Actinomadura rubteroloni TaxID=1926885 RepID=A0A2P4UAX5_9ACTN|nr:hypothetical protein [Actinomadura rubteroloni]POM22200.1 hypothetical protein BTM25_56120 [Actinomadura rubteroloni]
MLALAAAFVFALALLFDLADLSSGSVGVQTLIVLGLLLLALEMAGVGPARRAAWPRRRRR